MPIKVLSDLHGATAALSSEVASSDTLLLLGDLINVLDYTRLDGILVDVYGREGVREWVDLRTAGRFEEAASVMAALRSTAGPEFMNEFRMRVEVQYRAVSKCLPPKTFLIHGNVDWPSVADAILTDATNVDGKVIELGGLTFGFVGGGLATPTRVGGNLIPEDQFNAKLEAIGRVDVLCSHMPPAIPEFTHDTLTGRDEGGSPGLVEYVDQMQPRVVMFGHVHQPLVSSGHRGQTHLLNVGYFRRTGRASTVQF